MPVKNVGKRRQLEFVSPDGCTTHVPDFPTSRSPAPARRWAASCFDGFLSSKKSHSWPVECVGAAIGRPPAWRSSAFSGKVFHRQTGTAEQCSPLQEFFCSLKKNCKPAICWLAIFLSPAEGLFRRSLSFTARPARSARG